jgi:hypothetical protein
MHRAVDRMTELNAWDHEARVKRLRTASACATWSSR